jgi:hypothetical protein
MAVMTEADNSAATEVQTVASKLISVKMDPDIARLCKACAALKDMTLADYLTAVLRPVAEKDLASFGQWFKPSQPQQIETEQPEDKKKRRGQ